MNVDRLFNKACVTVLCAMLAALAATSGIAQSNITAWGRNVEGQATPPAGEFTRVAGGYFHSLGVKSDGTVEAWGSNNYGQLNVPALPAGVTYTEVAAGERHSLALKSDGTVAAFGNNSYGQLNVPALPAGVTYTGVAAGLLHSVLLRSDGSVVAFGSNSRGQINVPALPAGVTYTQVAGGYENTLFVRSDGTAVGAGYSYSGALTPPALPAGLTYTKVSLGQYHACYLRSDGQLIGRGYGPYGGADASPPAGQVFTDVASGRLHRLLLTSEGEVQAIGDSGQGQLDVPSLPAGTTYVALGSGGDNYHSLALTFSSVRFTMNGAAEEEILLGDTFTDAGVTAEDADGNSLAVTVTGAVDENTVGTYVLTYSATDGDGNTAQVTRVVRVLKKLASDLWIAAMSSYTDVQADSIESKAYANAVKDEPIAVWGRAWNGSPPYSYTLDFGDGNSVSGAVADPSFIGEDHTYTGANKYTMTLTVTDSAGQTETRKAAIQVFLATDDKIKDIRRNIAIERGLLWLYKNHLTAGDQVYWDAGTNEYQLGTVGFGTLAFEENGHKPGNDYEEDIYAELVQGGLNRILNWGSGRTTHGSAQFNDHSDGIAVRDMDYLNGNGFGAYLWNGGHATYVNGICGLALALAQENATQAQAAIIAGGPFDGLSYYEVMQDLTEQLSFCMSDGTSRGGWFYNVTTANSNRRDGSSQQWPCLLMRGASDIHGIEPADWVKDGIDVAFNWLQNANGAVGYSSNTHWLNSGKTGGAMVGWSVAGKDASYASVQSAIGYLGNQYYQPGGWNPQQGWAGYFYSMYGCKKGLSLMGVETISTANGPRDWYGDMCAWLLGDDLDATHQLISPSQRISNQGFGQHTDGKWTGNSAGGADRYIPYATANAILILTPGVTVPLPDAVITPFWDVAREVKAGDNLNVSGSDSSHAGEPDFVINQYLWILRPDDPANPGTPLGTLDWTSPDYSGVNIVLDRDPGDANANGLLPGVYHLTLQVRDDADPAQFDQSTETFEAVNKNFGPVAVPIPPGQVAYTGEFVPGNNVEVTLDGTHSSDPEGDPIVSYAWDTDGDGDYDDAVGATPTLTFAVANTYTVRLQVCSQDEFGEIKCSSNQADVNINITEFDLYVASIVSSDIVQGVSADLTIEFGSDLADPLSGVQVQFFDGLPPAYGGSGAALGSIEAIDFTDSGGGVFTASLFVDDLALGATTEEVYVFLDSNLSFPEHDESQDSNLGIANVSNQPPVAMAQNVVVEASANCQGEVSAAQVNNGSSDPDGDDLTLSLDPAGPYALGDTAVTLTVSDGKEEATATATITVVDVTLPTVVSCPVDQTIECPAVPVFGTPEFADNCGVVSVTSQDEDLAISGKEASKTRRTWTASDASGNSISCSQTITAEDTTAPTVVSCPSDVVLECPETQDFGTPEFADTCDTDLAVTSEDESLPLVGKEVSKTQRTWTATDDQGNSVSCSQTITVEDNTAPTVVSCPADETIECPAVPVFGTPEFADTCDTDLAVTSEDEDLPLAGKEVSKTRRTWTATDDHGNSVSCSQTITAEDTTAPTVVSCPSDVVLECPETQDFGTPEFADTCDTDLTVTSEDEELPLVGKEVSKARRTWTATDDHGNSVSCSQTITVEDNTPPVIEPGASDLTVECDGAGNLDDLEGWLLSNGGALATDTCGDVTWSDDFDGLSDLCGGTGAATVTFTATDPSGNTATTSAKFTIADSTPPDLAFERDGVEVSKPDGGCGDSTTITMKPNEVPVVIDVVASDICSDVTTVTTFTCHKVNKKGKIIDKADSCEIEVVGDKVTILDSGGVGDIITLTATTRDDCGNTCTRKLIINVVNPGNGGNNGGGGGSTANEGVGNGVDGNTPGHDNNGGNDDPGNTPGNPGAKGKKK